MPGSRLFTQRMLEPCGSRSITVGFMSRAAKKLARLVVMVDFPEPTLGFSMTMRCIVNPSGHNKVETLTGYTSIAAVIRCVDSQSTDIHATAKTSIHFRRL